jgi:hypothetical protein
VSEEDPGKNYKTTYKINNGSATDGRDASFKMDKEINIAFINKSTMEPPVTGRTLANNGLMVLMFLVLAISIVGMVFFKGIKKKN